MSKVGKTPKAEVLDAEISVGPQRKKTSVYLDPLIFEHFRVSCAKVGQSTCGVLEPFMYAFSRAVSAGDYRDPRPLTVNLNVNRVVQRVRRRGVEAVYDEIPSDLGAEHKCFICGQQPYYLVQLHRVDPPRQGYLCPGCYHYVAAKGGTSLVKIKDFPGVWVAPK